MVIYVFLIFHCLVALLAEVNQWWLEILTMITTMVGGAFGFLIINLPMMRWDWKISSQVVTFLLLALYFAATLGGWAYLLYFAIINNIACGQEAANLAASILNLVSAATFIMTCFCLTGHCLFLLQPAFGVPGNLQSLVPTCSQEEYSHSIIVAIFCGTGSLMVLMTVFLSVVLAGKIGCGTPLQLDDSDYGTS